MRKVKATINMQTMRCKVAAAPNKDLVSGMYEYWITSWGQLARGKIAKTIAVPQGDPIIILNYDTVEVLV